MVRGLSALILRANGAYGTSGPGSVRAVASGVGKSSSICMQAEQLTIAFTADLLTFPAVDQM